MGILFSPTPRLLPSLGTGALHRAHPLTIQCLLTLFRRMLGVSSAFPFQDHMEDKIMLNCLSVLVLTTHDERKPQICPIFIRIYIDQDVRGILGGSCYRANLVVTVLWVIRTLRAAMC